MNILFDFISTQGYINGGAEYTLRLFEEIYCRLVGKGEEFKIFCLYNSTQKFVYEGYAPADLKIKPHIEIVDIKYKAIENIVEDKDIDIFFIGIGQRYPNVSFSNLKCRICVVIHDVVFGEMCDSKLKDIFYLYDKRRLFYHYFVIPLKDRFLGRRKQQVSDSERRMAEHILKSTNVDVITVSHFSKNAICTLYDIPENRIKVFWSPQKLTKSDGQIDNEELEAIINTGNKYLMMLSVGREIKNLTRVLRAMKIYNEKKKVPLYLITTGIDKSYFDWHLSFKSLSVSDLENAYRHCYALMYASLHEGFGYPPIEAMKYGKPVLSSNVCSLPEVLGDAPIYFSPFYVSDIVFSIRRLEGDYPSSCVRSRERYSYISQKQKEDLESLVSFILQ